MPAHEDIVPSDWLEFGDWTDRSAVLPEEFWRTLVANRGPDGTNMPTYYPRACMHALLHSVEGGGLETNRILAECSSSIVAKFLRRVQAVVWMRSLCKTTNDVLGLVPKSTKEGDLVSILYGCSVPVMPRKVAVEPSKTLKRNYATCKQCRHKTSYNSCCYRRLHRDGARSKCGTCNSNGWACK